jgi:serine/threonine protein kinase
MDDSEKILKQHLSYQSYSFIGMGTSGRVYKVVRNDIIECVKIIPKENFKEGEYEVSFRLRNNKNILVSKQKYSINEYVVLIMDFVDGSDLKNYVKKYPRNFDKDEIFDMVSQILYGITAIHQNNAAHRYKMDLYFL